MKWLDSLPLWPTAIVAALLALAPFSPEPHLWEKLKLLQTGSLVQAIDVFDLVMHGTGALLLTLKLGRWWVLKK